jgi:hypothetical protein
MRDRVINTGAIDENPAPVAQAIDVLPAVLRHRVLLTPLFEIGDIVEISVKHYVTEVSEVNAHELTTRTNIRRST